MPFFFLGGGGKVVGSSPNSQTEHPLSVVRKCLFHIRWPLLKTIEYEYWLNINWRVEYARGAEDDALNIYLL